MPVAGLSSVVPGMKGRNNVLKEAQRLAQANELGPRAESARRRFNSLARQGSEFFWLPDHSPA